MTRRSKISDQELQALLKEVEPLFENHVVVTADTDQNRLVLSREDSKIFVEAILNPPQPTEALKRAAARHRETMLNKTPTPEELAYDRLCEEADQDARDAADLHVMDMEAEAKRRGENS